MLCSRQARTTPALTTVGCAGFTYASRCSYPKPLEPATLASGRDCHLGTNVPRCQVREDRGRALRAGGHLFGSRRRTPSPGPAALPVNCRCLSGDAPVPRAVNPPLSSCVNISASSNARNAASSAVLILLLLSLLGFARSSRVPPNVAVDYLSAQARPARAFVAIGGSIPGAAERARRPSSPSGENSSPARLAEGGAPSRRAAPRVHECHTAHTPTSPCRRRVTAIRFPSRWQLLA